MEPSRTGAADACRVVLSTPAASVGLTLCPLTDAAPT